MTVKTITITQEAYANIKRLKGDSESFSHLFNRISKQELTVNDLVGIFKCTPKEHKQAQMRLQKIRKELGEGMAKREAYVRSRLKHSH